MCGCRILLEKTAILILNWNQSLLTIELIKKFLSENEYGLIVVDNHSNKENEKLLEDFCQRNIFKVIDENTLKERSEKLNSSRFLLKLNKNYGYARGNNFGIRFVAELGIRYCLLINNDVSFDVNIINDLTNLFNLDNKIALIGPRILDSRKKQQGPIKRQNLINMTLYNLFFPLAWSLAKVVNYLKKRHKNLSDRYVFGISGCFMLFDVSLLNKVNNFDENTFLYQEEMILAEKLKRANLKTYYTEDFYVFHLHAQSTNLKPRKEIRKYKIDSIKYYWTKYRNCGDFAIKIIIFSWNIRDYFWEPLIKLLKKVFKKL